MMFHILLGLTIASVFGVEGGPISSCAGSGEEREVDGQKYSFFDCDLNAENARTKCNAEGKVLIKVSAELLGSLGSLGDETFWTAATNRYKNTPDKWEWLDYGEDATEAANGQNTRRNCLAVENQALVEKNCYTTEMNFVCAPKPTNPTQVGPRENLVFSGVVNMINEGSHSGCPWRAADEDTGTDYEKNTCALTLDVADPWFVVGLGSKKTISEVAVTGRSEPAQEQDVPYVALENFKVAVSDSFDWENFNPSDWTECGSYADALRSGERVSIPCAAEGAYVAVYVTGRSTSLQICNAEIYA